MTSGEVRDKFHSLTRDVLDGATADRIWDCVNHLEEEPSVAPLTALLRSARGQRRGAA
jgi:hypothetical protein